MVRKHMLGLFCVFALFVSMACGLVNSSIAPDAEKPTVVAVQQATQPAPPTQAIDTADTQAAQQSAETAAAAEAVSKSATESASTKKTQQAEAIKALTLSVKAQVTQQAADLYGLVEMIHFAGDLKRTAGEYHIIEDFDQSWAQIGYYKWWPTGLEPANFVLRAHTSWESASKTADWFNSGCGFVFRNIDEKNHYMIYLALDGNVYLGGLVNGVYKEIGEGFAGKLDNMKGEAEVVLVAEDDVIQFYVNNKKVFTRKNAYFDKGALNLTLVSGTNKGFGTRCEMTHIEVWDLGE